MNRALSVTGKSSNEIYTILFPQNLLKFIKYDFAAFAERCIDLCRVSIKKGEYNLDEVSALRSSISPCHRYYEKNMYGVFEKIVVDCWIEYICRQNEINPPTLWNSFTPCRNAFETAVFARLCEYRYGYAINQWSNILKIQEYAVKKTEFIFGKKLERPSMASARAGYFDLLFNVAANEMGYSSAISSSKVYSALRSPNSPFIASGVSREILRNVLKDVRYTESDDLSQSGRQDSSALSDRLAMDAFSVIKSYIPEDSDSIINTIIKSISKTPQRVYIPESFKAVVDLEIDSLIESGAVIQRCARCREYFVRDEDYDYDCCSRTENGRTCLDIMSETTDTVKRPPAVDPTVLYARCDQLYKEMSERVNVDITQRDFSDWYRYMILIRDNVASGMASMDDFENFAEYSRQISFPSHSKSLLLKEKEEAEAKEAKSSDKSKEARPFVFEKIETKDGEKVPKKETLGDILGITGGSLASSFGMGGMGGFAAYPMPMQAAVLPPSVVPASPPVYSPPNSRVIRGAVPSGVNIIGVESIPVAAPPLTAGKVAGDRRDDFDVIPKNKESRVHADIGETARPFANENLQTAFSDENPERSQAREISAAFDGDVKIYSIKEPAEDSPDEFVKVYQSSDLGDKPKKTVGETKEVREVKTNHKYEKGGLLKNPYIREIIKSDDLKAQGVPTVELPPPDIERAEDAGYPRIRDTGYEGELSGEETKDASEQIPEAVPFTEPIAEPLVEPFTEPNPEPLVIKAPVVGQKQESFLNFSNILAGLERKDGFETEDEPTASHKTKRVMNAIFGNTGNTNPFVNIEKKGDEPLQDEDYD